MIVIVHGILLAFGLILPLGVQNIFVFNQGVLGRRYMNAVPAAFTASVCDTLLIMASVYGVSVAVLAFDWVRYILIVAGVLFLLYVGWSVWKNSAAAERADLRETFPAGKQVAFAAMVSLLNPHAILDTVGVIGTSSLRYEGTERLAFALTCVAVSWVWFFSLAFAGRMAGRLDQSGRGLTLMNRASALLIWGSAAYLLYSLTD
ncbi:LysE family L-lysine exporter [Cohnella kolymensis]|uniref:LysE family L-lysine exporter n=1 Tax=Cohnella kolymensis TaxID=1590652 RepID=A0ABR5A9K8_9BACL|nr:LysE family L-lysine exporter [Cohnella kolymensis]